MTIDNWYVGFCLWMYYKYSEWVCMIHFWVSDLSQPNSSTYSFVHILIPFISLLYQSTYIMIMQLWALSSSPYPVICHSYQLAYPFLSHFIIKSKPKSGLYIFNIIFTGRILKIPVYSPLKAWLFQIRNGNFLNSIHLNFLFPYHFISISVIIAVGSSFSPFHSFQSPSFLWSWLINNCSSYRLNDSPFSAKF